MRNIVLGRGSSVWRSLKNEPALHGMDVQAIGHADLGHFEFATTDRVWVLSYSRKVSENTAMLARLRDAGVGEIVYVSSSSAIVTEHTRCYEYPRIKAHAEGEALAAPQAKVLTVGLMYRCAHDLPGGANVATSFDELAAFMRRPHWPDGSSRRKHLFRVVEQPFSNGLEAVLHRLYGRLLRLAAARPCLLRPLDLLLRTLGMRWYGYTYLSNRLWTSTTS